MADNLPTMVELLRTATTPFEGKVIKGMVDHFPAAELLPVVTHGALFGKYRERQSLPTTGTRKLNDTFDADYGTNQPQTYELPIYGFMIRADEQILSEPDGKEWLSDQIDAQTESLGYAIANDVINGDSASDPETMDGLKVWSTLKPSRLTIDAAGLDLSTAANREANADAFATYLDRSIQRGQQFMGRKPNVIIMPNDLEWQLPSIWRTAGYLKTTDDQVGRDFNSYKGITLRSAGFTRSGAFDASSEILTNTHDGSYTSLYLLWTGEDGVHLRQKHRLHIVRGGKNSGDDSTEDNLVYAALKGEWPLTVVCKDKSLVRLKGLKLA